MIESALEWSWIIEQELQKEEPARFMINTLAAHLNYYLLKLFEINSPKKASEYDTDVFVDTKSGGCMFINLKISDVKKELNSESI